MKKYLSLTMSCAIIYHRFHKYCVTDINVQIPEIETVWLCSYSYEMSVVASLI